MADAANDAAGAADKAGDVERSGTVRRVLASLSFDELVEGLAKSSGNQAIEFAEEIARRSTHRAGDVDRVVLGKWPGYINEAKTNGGIWYETPDSFFPSLQRQAGAAASEKAWLVNEAFLKQQMSRGVDRIEFTTEGLQHAVTNRSSFSAKELQFLEANASAFRYVREGAAYVSN